MDIRELMQQVQDAQEQTVRRQFGRASYIVNYMVWQRKADGSRVTDPDTGKMKPPAKVSEQEYTAAPRGDRQMEFVFGADARGWKSDLEYTTTRSVRVGGPDWKRTWDSLIRVCGGEEQAMNVLNRTAAEEVYWAWDDMPSLDPKKVSNTTGAPLSMPVFVKVYATEEEAQKEYLERWGSGKARLTPADAEKVSFLWKMASGDKEKLRALILQEPTLADKVDLALELY